jgi:hypothetical protein
MDAQAVIVRLRHAIRPFVPVGLVDLLSRQQYRHEQAQETARRQRFESLCGSVACAIGMVRALDRSQCTDRRFLEMEFIPALGLNDELQHEQPIELAHAYGKGLHIWQYPKQLAGYLAWLADNAASVAAYMEIGCRWGGMFILVSEWLRHNGAHLRTVVAVDPIAPTPFIDTYFHLLRQEREAGRSAVEALYMQAFSTSSVVREAVERIRPDFVFIDGDHRLAGALADHMLVRDHARIVVHHDISSQACPDTTFLWTVLKTLEAPVFDTVEFTEQYDSVSGQFLGIGVLQRRPGA